MANCISFKLIPVVKFIKTNSNLSGNELFRQIKKFFGLTEEEQFKQAYIWLGNFGKKPESTLEKLLSTDDDSTSVDNNPKPTPRRVTPNMSLMLDDFFGSSVVRNVLIKDFTKNVIYSTFIDLQNFTEISTDADRTKNLLKYKAQLLSDCIAFYKKSRKMEDQPLLYDSDYKLHALNDNVFTTLNDFFGKKTSQDLNVRVSREDPFVNAYYKWFAFKHFDDLLSYTFRDLIHIDPRWMAKDPESASLTKYRITSGDRLAIGWNDKEKMPDEVMNKVVEYLLNSFSRYRFGDTSPLQNDFLSKTDLNITAEQLKRLFLNENFINLNLPDDIWNKYEIVIDELSKKYNKRIATFKDLVWLAREYPTEIYPIIFDGIIEKYNTLPPNLKYNLSIDSIYSIGYNLFISDNSLAKAAERNKNAEYYLQKFIQQIDLTSPNNQTTINIAEHKVESLHSGATSRFQKNTERSINAALSGDFTTNVKISYDKKYTVSLKDFFEAEYDPQTKSNPIKISYNSNKTPQQIFSELKEFYHYIFQLDFNNEIFVQQQLAAAGNDYKKLNDTLLRIAIPMYAKHDWIKQYQFKDDATLKKDAADRFGEDAPKSNFRTSQHISFISNRDLAYFSQMCARFVSSTGRLQRNVQIAADGNMIAAQSITNGATETPARWETSSKLSNSASKHFSIFRVYFGEEKLRDLKNSGLYKKATRSTFQENMFTRIIYDYLIPKFSENSYIKVLYGVTSDKEDVGKKLFKLGIASKGDLINEIKQFYENIKKNVTSDYNKLGLYLQKDYVKDTLSRVFNVSADNLKINQSSFNPFEELNKTGKAYDILIYAITMYNADRNVSGTVNFVLNCHYQIDKNGILQKNHLLDAFIDRFDKDYSNFIQLKNIEFISDLYREKFSANIYAQDGTIINESLKQLFEKGNNKYEWVTRGGNIILSRYITASGKSYIGDSNFLTQIKEITKIEDNKYYLKNGDYILLNPHLCEFNELQFLYSHEYECATLGSHIFCEPKKALAKLEENLPTLQTRALLTRQEIAAMTDFTKRNVDQSATVNQILLNTLEGPSSVINVAYIDDETATAITVSGIEDKVKPFDGATYVEAIAHRLFNALNDKSINHASKPLITGVLPEYGTGLIIKTAGFANTNERMRKSPQRALMERKALSAKSFTEEIDITKDYLGNDILYEDTYIKSGNKYFKLSKIQRINEPNNKYNIVYTECAENGEPINSRSKILEINLNNLWDIYQVFGGINSYSLINGKLQLSDVSIDNMVTAVNRVGNGRGTSQLTVNQTLKKYLVSLLVTAGACKKGITNVNPKSRYYDNEPLATTAIKLTQFGPQLDPTHSVDQSEVSLMTQVMAGLSSSHSLDLTNDVYSALNSLTALNNKKFDGDDISFKDKIAKLFVKSVAKESRNNMLKQQLMPLISRARSGEEVTMDKVLEYVSFNDAGMLNYINSLLASELNQSSIRSKFAGTLSVLNPSYGIQKLYTGLVDGKLVHNRHYDALTLEQLLVPPQEVETIEMGHTYTYTDKNGFSRTTTVNDLYEYLDVRNGGNIKEIFYKEFDINDNSVGSDIYKINDNGKEKIVDFSDLITYATYKDAQRISKIQILGRDLQAYNIKFKTTTKDGRIAKRQIWDLDLVKEAFDNQKDQGIRLKMQELLDNISEGKVYDVMIDGQIETIDPESVKVYDYEVIAPPIFKRQFGIRSTDNVQELLDNPKIFQQRLLENIFTRNDKVAEVSDIELRRSNGQHLYITNENLEGRYNKVRFEIEEENGILWRVDEQSGEKMHKLKSRDDTIYLVGDQEVIWTPEETLKQYLLEDATFRVVSKKAMPQDIDKNELSILKEEELSLAQRKIYDEKDYNYILNEYKQIRVNGVYNSFKKALEALVARIPAQGMSSFMTMRIVNFTGDDTNNIYVNHMQIFLQGSDFDIDKATMMQYNISKSGKFIGWSPLFDYYHLEESLNLPLPEKTKVITYADKGESLSKMLNDAGITSEWIKSFDGLTRREKLKQLAVILRRIKGGAFINDVDENTRKFVRDVLNRHNNYLDKLDTDRAEDAIQNFITHTSAKISKDPKNLLLSQMPIDVAKEPLGKIADTSTIAVSTEMRSKITDYTNESYENQQRSILGTPGNEAIKSVDLINVFTGKDGISVAASLGVKTYNALLNYVNNKIRQRDWQAVFSKLPLQITTVRKDENGNVIETVAHEYGMLASTDIKRLVSNDELESKLTKKQLQFIDTSLSSEDTRNTINAFVSFAVDNAKELRLGKLSADMNYMGLYIYAAIMGVPMEIARDILTSNTAQAIFKLMQGDIYSGIDNVSSIKRIEQTLRNPKELLSNIRPPKVIENDFGDTLNKERVKGKEIEERVRKVISDKLKDKNTSEEAKGQLILFEKRLSKQLNLMRLYEKANYLISLDEVRIKGKDGKEEMVNYNLRALKALQAGQEEIAKLRNLLGLNQGMKTELNKTLNFIYTIEGLLKMEGENGKMESVSFGDYISDLDIRAKVIQHYDSVKRTFNILDVMNSIPHYRGYLDTLGIHVKAMSFSDLYTTISKKFYKELKKKLRQIDDKQITTLENIIMRQIANDWLATQNIRLPIQYEKNKNRIATIKLGGDNANQLFVTYMNQVIIPKLKQGNLGDGVRNERIANNRFIKALQSEYVTRTPNKKGETTNRLDVETIPRTDIEKFALDEVIFDFDKIINESFIFRGDFGETRVNLLDLFWYYNLILNNTQNTKNSLMSIFINSAHNSTIKSYYEYLSKIDKKEIEITIPKDDRFIYPVVPISSRLAAEAKGLTYYWSINEKLHRYDLKHDTQQDNKGEFDPEEIRASRWQPVNNSDQAISRFWGYALDIKSNDNTIEILVDDKPIRVQVPRDSTGKPRINEDFSEHLAKFNEEKQNCQ